LKEVVNRLTNHELTNTSNSLSESESNKSVFGLTLHGYSSKGSMMRALVAPKRLHNDPSVAEEVAVTAPRLVTTLLLYDLNISIIKVNINTQSTSAK
jgi:hypothetical protein